MHQLALATRESRLVFCHVSEIVSSSPGVDSSPGYYYTNNYGATFLLQILCRTKPSIIHTDADRSMCAHVCACESMYMYVLYTHTVSCDQ